MWGCLSSCSFPGALSSGAVPCPCPQRGTPAALGACFGDWWTRIFSTAFGVLCLLLLDLFTQYLPSGEATNLVFFCCFASMYSKRDAQIVPTWTVKLLAFFLHYYFTEFSLHWNIFSSSPDFSNYFFHFYSCFFNDFESSDIMPLSWVCFSFSWYWNISRFHYHFSFCFSCYLNH